MDISIGIKNSLEHSLTFRKQRNNPNPRRNSISKSPKILKPNLPKKPLKKYRYFLPNKTNGNLFNSKVNPQYQGKITVSYRLILTL